VKLYNPHFQCRDRGTEPRSSSIIADFTQLFVVVIGALIILQVVRK